MPDIKGFFSEVGGGRSSRLSRILYIALHESEQVEVGGVTGSWELSCNSFFPILWNRRKNAIILQKVTFYIEFIAKRIK